MLTQSVTDETPKCALNSSVASLIKRGKAQQVSQKRFTPIEAKEQKVFGGGDSGGGGGVPEVWHLGYTGSPINHDMTSFEGSTASEKHPQTLTIFEIKVTRLNRLLTSSDFREIMMKRHPRIV